MSAAPQPQHTDTKDERTKFAMQKAEALSRNIERRAIEKVQQLQKMGIEVPGISAPISVQQQAQWAAPPPQLLPSTCSAADPSENGNGPVSLTNFTSPLLSSARYTEQMQKKKLIWGSKKAAETTTTTNKWETAKFSQDSDGKMASKFLRLMGAKNVPKPDDEPAADPTADSSIQKREEMFSTMEQQYEVARQATHTMRGMGLGFGSSRPF